MDTKVSLPIVSKKWVWWGITIILYGVSTIGLMAGLKIGLEVSLADAAGITISAVLAGWLGFLIGLAIQGWETWLILDWDESDRAERSFGLAMLVLDAVALFIAMGGHLNILWINQNQANTPGMITHVFGLTVEILSALLVSVGAELALRRTLKVMGVEPQQKAARVSSWKLPDFSGLMRRTAQFFRRPARAQSQSAPIKIVSQYRPGSRFHPTMPVGNH